MTTTTTTQLGWHSRGKHLADWPGGSGHCFCMCPSCWLKALPGPDGQDRSGVCVCRDCPCGGHERLPTVPAARWEART